MIPQKSLSLKYYNEFGLIDSNSEEFSVVKKLMDSRGFHLVSSIGSGNYAEVYLGFTPNKKKEIAIKVMDLIQSSNKYETEFIFREIDIVRKLSHKNIIKIYELIKTPNKIMIFMELAPNGNIADWISKRGPFTELMSWIMFVPILKGLDHMHSQKIAHRNLKLENILLSEKMNPKLSDFCYAIIVDHKRPKSSSFCGSLPYFSPEILQYLPYNPFISDIWSLGVCLYIMVSNRLPFDFDDPKDMLEKQIMGNWKFTQRVHSEYSQEIKAFIAMMLEPDISLRPNTKQLDKHKWIENESLLQRKAQLMGETQ